MPFARVGAMPQPNPASKQRHDKRTARGNSSSRHKGITMEDLKKQTALRLAHEQRQKQQQQTGTYHDLGNEQAFRSQSEFHPPAAGHLNYPRLSPFPDPYYRGETSEPPGPQQPYFPVDAPPHSVYASHDQPYSAVPHSAVPHRPTHVQANSRQNALPVPPNVMEGHTVQHPLYQTSEQVPFQQFQTQSSFDRDPSAAPQGSNKSKLPHGLTVYELKEMTKARLQAEASDRSEPQETAFESRRMSPLDFESIPEIRERAASRDSGRNNGATFLHHGSDSMNSIPSMVHVNQHTREQQPGRQPQVSPIPPGFQVLAHAPGPVPNYHPQQARTDAWESASVASGSDSVYSGGFGNGYVSTTEGDAPFNRGRPSAFTQHQGSDGSFSPAHASPGNGASLFDAAIRGGNRRRAVTLSPRTESIHEDHPIVHGEELRMPNFSSSSRGMLLSRTSRNSYSPVLDLGLDIALLGQQPGFAHLGGSDFNRRRTASATSLPPGTLVADEFNRDRANTFSGFTSSRAGGDALLVGISGALTESFLNTSRAESTPAVLAPPGFQSSDKSRPPGAGDSFHAFSSRTPREEMFGASQNGSTSLFSHESIDDLAENMGSILQLSGVGSYAQAQKQSGSNQNEFDTFRN